MADDSAPDRGMSYDVLHARARELISKGDLPREGSNRLYAGYGSNRSCQLCAIPISGKEIEYELEFQGSVAQPSRTRLVWFHLGCHAIWEYERKRHP